MNMTGCKSCERSKINMDLSSKCYYFGNYSIKNYLIQKADLNDIIFIKVNINFVFIFPYQGSLIEILYLHLAYRKISYDFFFILQSAMAEKTKKIMNL